MMWALRINFGREFTLLRVWLPAASSRTRSINGHMESIEILESR